MSFLFLALVAVLFSGAEPFFDKLHQGIIRVKLF